MTRVKLHFIAMAGASLLARGTGLVYARPTVRAARVDVVRGRVR